MKKEDLGFATELIAENRRNSKRWFVAFITTLILWFMTIGIFVWYIYQPIEEVETVTTQEADTQGDNSPVTQTIGE